MSAQVSEKPKKTREVNLSAQAHAQVLDLLRVAMESKDRGLREAAIQMAKSHQAHQHKSDAKLSPQAATLISTGILTAATVSVWWAAPHFSGNVAAAVISVTIALAIVLISLVALYAGFLSQIHVVTVIKSTFASLKWVNPSKWFRNNKIPVIAAGQGSSEDDGAAP